MKVKLIDTGVHFVLETSGGWVHSEVLTVKEAVNLAYRILSLTIMERSSEDKHNWESFKRSHNQGR